MALTNLNLEAAQRTPTQAWMVLFEIEEILAVVINERGRNPEAVPKLVSSSCRCHGTEIRMAQDYLDQAEQALEELQQRIGRSYLR